ncbi:condensation domain-containing protein, partial [Streptomyces sp. NPDC058682]|uniref:condensation domain-containing protein n=1 Tax=Streptomyces sp. NPDC058682 TaxID=3346596 RepID=UPI003653BCCE
MGRIDKQVKIRGYRIELGEIETRLREYAGVKDTVVIARADAAGNKSLTGYVVPTDEGVDPAELRTHLGATLPEYMIPAAFVALDVIPLTTNGKLDHRALPAPGQIAYTSGRYVAPRTPVEERLAGVWSEVLAQAEVGVESSFFELGGDSIRAVRLVGALRAAGYDLAVRDVFEHRTVAALAVHLSGQTGGASLINAVTPFTMLGEADRAALPADVVDAYPLSQIQTGMLVEMMAAGPESKDVYHNINSFRVPDAHTFSLPALRQALDIVVARHDILRTSMHLSGYTQPLQLVHAAAELPIAVHDVRALGVQEQDRAKSEYVERERANLFDLVSAPLMRIGVHIESDSAWRLTLSHCHAVTEGWTLNILLMELLTCYQQVRDGREVPAYEVPSVRYADFIAAELAAL